MGCPPDYGLRTTDYAGDHHREFDSREATVGIDSPSVDPQFMVLGTELDAEVRALVQATIPAIYANLVFQSYQIAHQGGSVWELSVRYGKLEPKETGQCSYTFDTGGGNLETTWPAPCVSGGI